MKFNSLKEAMIDYLSEAGVDKVEGLSEAILDGHAIPDLGDLSFLSGCAELGYLSLNKCDIKKLPVFPVGLAIERFELCDNKLHDSLESLANLESLEELHLGGNQFATIDSLKPLGSLKGLRILDITDCPVVEKEGELHQEIFKLVPSLEAFNGKDETGESVDFEDGSDDLDDYSDEESEEGSNDKDDDDEGDEDSDDEDDDDEDDDEDDEDDEGDERPTKTARHD